MSVAFTIEKPRASARTTATFARARGTRITAMLFAPLLAATGLLFNTTPLAHQDAASLIAASAGSSWTQAIERSPAGSTHAAKLAFTIDPATTGSVSPFGANVAGVGDVAISPDAAIIADTPDEARVVRSTKRDRLVRIAPVAPPKAFSAGSVLQRESSLLRPSLDGKAVAFAKPAMTKLEALALAQTFHVKPKARPLTDLMPVAVAKLVNNPVADSLALAYAAPDAAGSPFDAILNDAEKPARFVPQIGPKDHAWAKSVLPESVFTAKEQRCLAEGIYFEARGEVEKGQAAVAQVILNRVRNPTFPNTICGVVYQNITWFNRCQFSFACDRVKDRVVPGRHWETAKAIALAVTAGKIWIKEVGSSTHYHATYVHPDWAPTMVRLTRIGQHIFYRTRNGGWS